VIAIIGPYNVGFLSAPYNTAIHSIITGDKVYARVLKK
jgi:hypothetical protein